MYISIICSRRNVIKFTIHVLSLFLSQRYFLSPHKTRVMSRDGLHFLTTRFNIHS